MQVLYATGMRVSELMSLPVAACRGEPEFLLIKGKADKERIVPNFTARSLNPVAVSPRSRGKRKVNEGHDASPSSSIARETGAFNAPLVLPKHQTGPFMLVLMQVS